MVVPHPTGTKTVKIKFHKLDDLPKVELPNITVTKCEVLIPENDAKGHEIKPDLGFGSLAFKKLETNHSQKESA